MKQSTVSYRDESKSVSARIDALLERMLLEVTVPKTCQTYFTETTVEGEE